LSTKLSKIASQFIFLCLFSKDKPSYLLFIDRKRKKIVVVVRSTKTPCDISADLSILPEEVSLNEVKGYFHKGFYERGKQLKDALFASIMKIKETENFPVIVVGHSLGGSSATILTLLCKEST
jgi:hypothetical protein